MAWSLRNRASMPWRDISSDLLNGWTGKVYAARRGPTVLVRVHQLAAAAATSNSAIAFAPGLRPTSLASSVERPMLHTTAPALRRCYFAGSTLVVSGQQPADQLYGDFRFDTLDAMPATDLGAAP